MYRKLVCRLLGHNRGVRIGQANVGGSLPQAAMFECPRCHATWTRKVYPRAAKSGAAK